MSMFKNPMFTEPVKLSDEQFNYLESEIWKIASEIYLSRAFELVDHEIIEREKGKCDEMYSKVCQNKSHVYSDSIVHDITVSTKSQMLRLIIDDYLNSL